MYYGTEFILEKYIKVKGAIPVSGFTNENSLNEQTEGLQEFVDGLLDIVRIKSLISSTIVITATDDYIVPNEATQKSAKALDANLIVLSSGKHFITCDGYTDYINIIGGDSSIASNPEKLPQAKYKIDVPALKSGFVSNMVADEICIATMVLGARRATKDEKIDLAVGLILRKKVVDKVQKGETLLIIYSNCANVDGMKNKIYKNLSISAKAQKSILIHKIT